MLLCFGPAPRRQIEAGALTVPVLSVGDELDDVEGLAAQRYDARPGTVYLLRPDQYVAARWRRFDESKLRAALTRALHA